MTNDKAAIAAESVTRLIMVEIAQMAGTSAQDAVVRCSEFDRVEEPWRRLLEGDLESPVALAEDVFSLRFKLGAVLELEASLLAIGQALRIQWGESRKTLHAPLTFDDPVERPGAS